MNIFAFILRQHARLRVKARLHKQRRLERDVLNRMPEWLQQDAGALFDEHRTESESPCHEVLPQKPRLVVIECNPQAVRQGHRHKVVHRRRFAVFRRDEKRHAKGGGRPDDPDWPPAV